MTSPIKSPIKDASQILQETGEVAWKSELEFSRYKQDCRKRALDLAASHQNIDITGRKFEVEKEKVISYADYYYNWLINLPQ